MIRSRMTRTLAAAVAIGVLAVLAPASPALGQIQPQTPPARAFYGMAYDDATGQVVLFGGRAQGAAYGDTWTWDGTDWTQQHPAHSPPPGSEMGMAYDAGDGLVVLFDQDQETWTWDGTDWTRQHPAHLPPGQNDGIALAYDAGDGLVLLVELGQTWTWDGTDWTQQHPAHSPQARFFPSMAYDASEGEIVLFGGGHNGSVPLKDTWTWDGTDWTQQHPAHAPRPRYGAGIAYDPANAGLVLFGGNGGCRNCGDFGVHGDTRVWDGTDWRLARHSRYPEPRMFLQMTYDAAEGQVVSFGGYDVYHYYGDTWTWDGTAWAKHPYESISVRPGSAAPGTSVHVRGQGFTGYEGVQITFRDSVHGVTVLKYARTDDSGQFTARVRIPSGATAGRQQIVVKGLLGLETAKQGFTVT